MALRQFILKPKPTAVVLCLKDTQQVWYPSKLAHASGASYVYVTHWLNKLEKAGWVKLEKQGRLKVVVATENGVAIASMLDELVRKMDAHTSKGSTGGAGTTEAEAAKKEKAAGEAKEKEKKQE